MIAKWIRCAVPDDQQDTFSQGQARWAPVAACAGFEGQLGGYAEGEAHVFALWRGLRAYQGFMERDHDRLAAGAAQGGAYTSIEVDLLQHLLDMPGEQPDLAAALPGAALLRVADCQVKPERELEFCEAQEEVWAKGMAGVPGMLGGAFWSKRGAEARFVVTTAWASVEAHDAYVKGALPKLRKAARSDDDLVALRGILLPLLPAWTVTPSRRR